MENKDYEKEKELAAEEAVSLVKDGMIVGLGSGSTASYAIRKLGERVQEGLRILGIPTSENSRKLAISVGISLTTLENEPNIDITVDGADRFNKNLELIKGGGGALLREKIVAYASKKVVIIVDSRKLSDPLGGFPIPVEVIQFGTRPLINNFNEKCLNPNLRIIKEKNQPFITDEGNYILDLDLKTVCNPKDLVDLIDAPGVVEHGLFIDLADEIYMGSGNDVIHFFRPNS